MPVFLFDKNVDQSLLKSGLTVPKEQQEELLKSVGIQLEKGEKTNIKIFINGTSYEAVLTNVNFTNTDRVVLQIRYGEQSAICTKLKEIFSYSASLIEKNSEEKVNEESLKIYATGEHALEFVCFPMTQGGTIMNIKGNMRDA